MNDDTLTKSNMKKDPCITDRLPDEKPETDDLDVLLSPRCDFHVSQGFKQRLMAEAASTKKRHRRRWLPLALTSAAASIAIIALPLALFRHSNETTSTLPPATTARVEIPELPQADTTAQNPAHELIAETLKPGQEKPTIRKTSPKSHHLSGIHSDQQSSKEAVAEDTKKNQAIEGEMPMGCRNKSIDPEEVRVRRMETRRNAEMAYLERMRDEIEATRAYIAQLKTEEIVY